jgi:predicted dehydrogenase
MPEGSVYEIIEIMKNQNNLRWGIISTGIIAHKMAAAIGQASGSEVWGVASRNLESAQLFAKEYGIQNAIAPYSELIAHPDVDIIYIGVPNPFHYELIIESLNHGKHVLCEKPFTLNARETKACIDLARKKNLFLMEALWTRFFPVMQEVKQLVQEGEIGKVHQVTGDFLIERDYDPKHRLYNIDLGGGALLDIGVYLLSVAQFFLGSPESAEGITRMGSTGVDMLDNLHLRYPGDVYASLVCGFTGHKPQEFTISGSKGYCKIPSPFYCPSSYVIGNKELERTFARHYWGNGYAYMIEAVSRSILKGETEHPLMPLEETLFQMETMDELRRQWGLVYPGEKQ